jgi:endonuclease G
MKKLSIPGLIVVLCGAVALLVLGPGKGTLNLADHSFLPAFDTSLLVIHKYYSLSYNDDSEQPYWVAYTIVPDMMEALVERPSYFRVDTLVSTGTSDADDYYKSGYDRGHLVPAADMQFDSLAIRETFFYSNISPQLPGFNRGVWKRLEELIRKRSGVYDSLIVITGPVINTASIRIGENQVAIPDSFFKILIQFRGSDLTVTPYLIPHISSRSDLSDYIVTVDSIEIVTGIDFFSDLPDKFENRLERGE